MTGNIGSCQRRYDGYQLAVKTFLQDKITWKMQCKATWIVCCFIYAIENYLDYSNRI